MSNDPKPMTLMPPAVDACQVCAVKHALEDPHDPNSLYWQTKRHIDGLDPPTWIDATEHLDDKRYELVREFLAGHDLHIPERTLTVETPDGSRKVGAED